ncbi:MAG: prepilin-type N-terminal cleavage/methylation domain-containing protein [Kiritimatiellae bacterium]|nr:prepilin-type N-terminal cleavage/methylation domain-containing protein [Kiritimatiellia bacterium]
MDRKGFTLIEVLVASLLLSMLVMILTMVFNQSSIAWRTGKASVAEMDMVRRRLSVIQKQSDDVIPGVQAGSMTVGRVVSAWEEGSGGSRLRSRAVDSLGSTELTVAGINPRSSSGRAWQQSAGMSDNGLGTVNAFVVGVWSYGKDGKPNTEDDVTTWPDDMD